MDLSVIIPTYNRPADLDRLLESITEQILKPNEIIVVIGPNDRQSKVVVTKWADVNKSIRYLDATKPSLVHSLNLGIQNAKGDIICLLDDDVKLPADWAKKIHDAYTANDNLGAYGGRDKIQLDVDGLMNPNPAEKVGTYKWSGVLQGNHHCGSKASPTEVDVLKGVNLSFRAKALGELKIDTNLESSGAEICTEIEICQRIKKRGYTVVYDNENFLYHFVSPRSADDDRNNLFTDAVKARFFNQALVTAKFRPVHELLFFLGRTLFIGSRKQPGLLRAILLVNKHGLEVIKLPFLHIRYAINGAKAGLKQRSLYKAD